MQCILWFSLVVESCPFGMKSPRCQFWISREAREIDGSILVLFDLAPTTLANELLLFYSQIHIITVLTNSCCIVCFMDIYNDAIFRSNVSKRGHKLTHSRKLLILLR
jgi:hypothetical protein